MHEYVGECESRFQVATGLELISPALISETASTIDCAASTHFAPLSAPASTPSQLSSSILAFTPSTPTDTTDTAALAAASAAVARFEADFYPDWFDHVTYTFLALFATFIVVCYGMVWYKIRVADRKMEERERWLESGSGRREDEGDRRDRDDDDRTDSDLERGRQEGPRRWSSPSSSSSSLRSPSRSKASYSEEESYDDESDLDSRPRRRRARTMRTASDTDYTGFFSTSSADTASTDDDDSSRVRPSTTRRPLPRQGWTATAEWDQLRAVRYSRRLGRSSEKTRVFGR